MIGPVTEYAQRLHAYKYRADDETFDDYCVRYARATSDSETHFRDLLDALRCQRLLPAGRQQLAVGRPFQLTASNCYVMGTIQDSMHGIMRALSESAATLRMGGGIGVDFSTIRPQGDPIDGLGLRAYASGPVSFMDLWNTMSSTIMSAGHRRGAMMGILRCDHPDIMKFVNAKQNHSRLTNFNISVAVTDEFMEALDADSLYPLRFKNRIYDRVRAADVWARIMERNWDWAEPGVIFIDRMNKTNPLNYCETIAATNPCSEQILPPYGNCLLGSLNMVKYLTPTSIQKDQFLLIQGHDINYNLMERDIYAAVRAFDNVIDISNYPLKAQEREAKAKRRIGVGVTGMANALEAMGYRYGTPDYIAQQSEVLKFLRNTVYSASIELAREKGSFPMFDAEKWLGTAWAATLPNSIRAKISVVGLRNGQLLSIAPTGTISQCADNVSAGIEPPYSLEYKRKVWFDDQEEITIQDYAYKFLKVKCKTALEVTPQEHIEVLAAAQQYIDSCVSKTCNINGKTPDGRGHVTFDEFKSIYHLAYKLGVKACSTFNINGKRAGILQASDVEPEACVYDPLTGEKSCEG